MSSWKLAAEDNKFLKSLEAVGESFESTKVLQNHLEELTCKFYKCECCTIQPLQDGKVL